MLNTLLVRYKADREALRLSLMKISGCPVDLQRTNLVFEQRTYFYPKGYLHLLLSASLRHFVIQCNAHIGIQSNAFVVSNEKKIVHSPFKLVPSKSVHCLAIKYITREFCTSSLTSMQKFIAFCINTGKGRYAY